MYKELNTTSLKKLRAHTYEYIMNQIMRIRAHIFVPEQFAKTFETLIILVAC